MENTTQLDSLIAKYRPKEATFQVKFPEGETFEFRTIADYLELKQFQAATKRFVDGVTKAPVPEEWEPYFLKDKAFLEGVYCVSELSVAPKLTLLDVMRLGRGAVFAFEHLKSQIDAMLTGQGNRLEEEALEAAKNESSETTSIDSD